MLGLGNDSLPFVDYWVILRLFLLFFLVVLVLRCPTCTCPALTVPSEVRFFAVPALVVIEMVEGELLDVVVVLGLRVLQSLVQVQSLMLCSLHALVHDIFFYFLRFVDRLCHPMVALRLKPLVALGTLGVLQINDQVVSPLAVQPVPNAVLVVDVLAGELDHGLLSQALHVADRAERVRVLTKSLGLVLVNAVWVKTGRMGGLVVVAVARMAAVEEITATGVRLPLALAEIAKILTRACSKVLSTKAAFSCVLIFFMLVAGFSNMVWFCFALGAEVASALIASDSEVIHVLCRSLRQSLSLLSFKLLRFFEVSLH